MQQTLLWISVPAPENMVEKSWRLGTAEDIMKNENSRDGSVSEPAELQIPVPKERRKPTGWITVKGARENNLKNINVKFPTGRD